MQKIFGTDGVRGIFGEEITPTLAYDIGRALALYTKDKEKSQILIAKDTRSSGDILLTSFVSGAMSMGVFVTYMGVTTTPSLSYTTRNFGFGVGVMITASHNSYEYNGIKIFKSNGEKLGVKEEKILTKIYKSLNNFSIAPASKCGKLLIKYNLGGKYFSYLKSLIKDKYFDFSVAFDCANGVTYKILQKLFDNNFKNVFIINISQNPRKVNFECGATDTKSLANFVVSNNLDFGFAFDGDGDRVVMVDSQGKLFDGDDILYNLALYLDKKNKLKKATVVGTTMTNLGLEKALKKEGIKLIREDVGDKYIVDRLVKDKLSLGGEKAGHIIPYEFTNTGDGVMTSLIMLNVIKKGGLTKVPELPQVFVNIKVSKKVKEGFLSNSKVNEYIEKVKSENEDIRLVVRPSGTENIIRIMVEGEAYDKCRLIADEISNFIQINCV